MIHNIPTLAEPGWRPRISLTFRHCPYPVRNVLVATTHEYSLFPKHPKNVFNIFVREDPPDWFASNRALVQLARKHNFEWLRVPVEVKDTAGLILQWDSLIAFADNIGTTHFLGWHDGLEYFAPKCRPKEGIVEFDPQPDFPGRILHADGPRGRDGKSIQP
jgi:hypothetical protein